MKKIFYILSVSMLLISCGPHRMRCGARGICEDTRGKAGQKFDKIKNPAL